MSKRLSVLIEGESLLNDGTAAAMFQVLLAAVIGGHLSGSGLQPGFRKDPARLATCDGLGWIAGGLALALALSLDRRFPARDQILVLTFGVVAFSILVQGLTMRPFLERLRLATDKPGPAPHQAE